MSLDAVWKVFPEMKRKKSIKSDDVPEKHVSNRIRKKLSTKHRHKSFMNDYSMQRFQEN